MKNSIPILLVICACAIILLSMGVVQWIYETQQSPPSKIFSPPIITDLKKILIGDLKCWPDSKPGSIMLLNHDGSNVAGFPILLNEYKKLMIPVSGNVYGDDTEEIVAAGLTYDNEIIVTIIGQDGGTIISEPISDKYSVYVSEPVITMDDNIGTILLCAICADDEESEEYEFTIFALQATDSGFETILNTPYCLHDKINKEMVDDYLENYEYKIKVISNIAIGPQLEGSMIKKDYSLPNGLVAYYKFDDVDNPEKDSSFYGNHLKNTGGYPDKAVNIIANDYDPKYGYAAEFIAEDHTYFHFQPEELPSTSPPGKEREKVISLDMNGSMTVSAWIYIPSPMENGMMILTRKFGDKAQYYYYINNEGRLSVSEDASSIDNSSEEPISIDSWHHIAYVKENHTVNCYIDGELKGSSNSDFYYWPIEKAGVYIGRNFSAVDGLADYGTFILDELAVWKRALSVEEINQMMVEGIPEQSLEEFVMQLADGSLAIYFVTPSNEGKGKIYGFATYFDEEENATTIGELIWSPLRGDHSFQCGADYDTLSSPEVDPTDGTVVFLDTKYAKVVTSGEEYINIFKKKVFYNEWGDPGNISLVDENGDGKLDYVVTLEVGQALKFKIIDHDTLKTILFWNTYGSHGYESLCDEILYPEIIVAKLTVNGETRNTYIFNECFTSTLGTQEYIYSDYQEGWSNHKYIQACAVGDIDGDGTTTEIVCVMANNKVQVVSKDSIPPVRHPWPYWRWKQSSVNYDPVIDLDPPDTNISITVGEEWEIQYTCSIKNKDENLKIWVEGLAGLVNAENYFDDSIGRWIIKWIPSEDYTETVHNITIKAQGTLSTTEKQITINVEEAPQTLPDLVVSDSSYVSKTYTMRDGNSVSIKYITAQIDNLNPESVIDKSFYVKCKFYLKFAYWKYYLGSKNVYIPAGTAFPKNVKFYLSYMDNLLNYFNSYKVSVDFTDAIEESNENNNSTPFISKYQ